MSAQSMRRIISFGSTLIIMPSCLTSRMEPTTIEQQDFRNEEDPLGHQTRGATRSGELPSADDPVEPLATLPPALEAASRAYARRVGVVIGIDEYGSGISRLSSAASDARSMAETLRTLGFDAVHELYDSGAKRSNIVDLLRSGLYEELGPNDLLVVFFAGHGMLGDDGESYLLPQDATTDIARTGLSMQYLKEAALGINVRAVLYLVDACLSGSMMRRKGNPSRKVDDEYWREARRSRVVQVISSATAVEGALETPDAGLFTGALRVGLLAGRADSNGDFVITTEELAAHTRRSVVADSGDRQHPQWATIEGSATVVMFDVRRIPERLRRIMPDIPREEVPGIEPKLADVHRLMEEMQWIDAEARIRELLLETPCPELHLLLAEVYLESGADQPGTFKHQALVERELENAETGILTDDQEARLFELRRLTKKIVRGEY